VTSITLTETVEALRAFGVNAATWDSGGGMEGIAIAADEQSVDEPQFFFGTAGSHWAGEVLEAPSEGVTTDVPANETDPKRIASGIILALGRYMTGSG
jgi:hypothetical protein